MRQLVLWVLFLAVACADRAPSRGGVVSLLPAWTEVIVRLGAGADLVACTVHGEPGRDVARVPWEGAGAVEAIVRLRPDLVIRQAPRAADDPLRDALAAAGVRVLSLPSETVADVRDGILRIGDALGRAERAEACVASFDAALARARAAVRGKERPTVLFVFGRDAGTIANIDAAGPGSFLDELIRCAGGRNALAGLATPYPRIRIETVVRLAPEVIIDNVPEGGDPLAAWQALPTLPAVKSGRVYGVRDNRLLIPGPRIPEAVERLVEMIHGRP